MDIGFLSLQRIAAVFGTPVEQLRRDGYLALILKSSFRSDFAFEADFDVINDDIHDVADRDTLRLLDEGRLVISTIGEYCEYMASMSQKNARAVRDVLMSSTGVRRKSRL